MAGGGKKGSGRAAARPQVIVEREARQELIAAAVWYEERDPGVGYSLLQAAGDAVERVAHTHGQPAGDEARRIPLDRFPLWAIFYEYPERKVVVSFAHSSQRPGFWRRRPRR